MAHQVAYTKQAIKSLSKIDQAQQRMIIAWIEKNLINTENPKSLFLIVGIEKLFNHKKIPFLLKCLSYRVHFK